MSFNGETARLLLTQSLREENVVGCDLENASDRQFLQAFRGTERAIEAGIYPERIRQGSSGSYRVFNLEKKPIGVFKPKDEEPYANLNPKWVKWMQKRCCPCCFGRPFLIPNQGYLSEAGASLVDDRLQLGIVPTTKIVKLASETFNYAVHDRAAAKIKENVAGHFPSAGRKFSRIGLPLKIGSFQFYVDGYRDAADWLRAFEAEPLPEPIDKELQLQFERLVVLDYVIRNTDRGNDNWLIRYETAKANLKSDESVEDFQNVSVTPPSIRLAAIDNGLSFPYKHPDGRRTYPYYWSSLKQARVPFSGETKQLVYSKLKDNAFVDGLCEALRQLFQVDKDFDKKTCNKQLSLMRGQILNLVEALEDGRTPAYLVGMPPR